MLTIGECVSVGEYIDIGYILPTIRGVCGSWWVSVARECFLSWIYVLVLYISCQQLGGYMSFGEYIDIGYILPTIGGHVFGEYIDIGYTFVWYTCVWWIHWYWIYSANNRGACVSSWVSVGPSGPGWGMFVSWIFIKDKVNVGGCECHVLLRERFKSKKGKKN